MSVSWLVSPICRTTKTAAGRSTGSWGSSSRRASMPPAEAPTTIVSRLAGGAGIASSRFGWVHSGNDAGPPPVATRRARAGGVPRRGPPRLGRDPELFLRRRALFLGGFSRLRFAGVDRSGEQRPGARHPLARGAEKFVVLDFGCGMARQELPGPGKG